MLTLSHPAALNALTWTMYRQMEAHLEHLAADETTRVILLLGEGKAFAVGTDIRQFQGFTGEDGIAYEHNVETIVELLYTIPKPTIAAIHGYAVGAGLVIASVCDLRYATPASRFGVPIAQTLSNCLTHNNYRHLVDAFGAMRTKEMLFTARSLTATEALHCGFLTAMVDEERRMTQVTEIAQHICALAPLTMLSVKETQRRVRTAEEAIDFDDVLARI